MKVHVLLRKEDIDPRRISGKPVVVIDALFATTTIVAALAHGASAVIPMQDRETCLAEASRRPEKSFVLAGEWATRTLDGFIAATPCAVINSEIANRTLLYCTSNGTAALRAVTEAKRVYASAIVNGTVTARHLLSEHDRETVIIVCAGSMGRFSLEDFVAAGFLISMLIKFSNRDIDLTDAALAARLLYDSTDMSACLKSSRVGKVFLERAEGQDVDFAATPDRFTLVAECLNGVISALPPARTGQDRPILPNCKS